MNNALKKLYQKECQRLKESNIKSHEFDGPLLMYCWEEEYLNSEYKILFLGRESNKWLEGLVLDPEACIERYKNFELCNYGNYNTPFWRYIYDFKNILMPQSVGQKNFLWSNVSKFSELDGTAVDMHNYKFFCDNFRVLESELDILKPDIVIFFTGNGWDEKIQYQISDKIGFHQVNDGIPKTELARLSSKYLPRHSYRTEHPITLSFQKKWNHMELIMNNIRKIPIDKGNNKGTDTIHIIENNLAEVISSLTDYKESLAKGQKYDKASKIQKIKVKIEKAQLDLNKYAKENYSQ